jgi:hypothetical protein
MLQKNPEERPSASEVVQTIEDFSLESKLKLGKWRVKEYANEPSQYLKKENGEMHAYYTSEAAKLESQGKEAQAHRYLYQASLFSGDPSDQTEVLSPSSYRKKVALAALIGIAVLALSSFLANQYLRPAPGQTQEKLPPEVEVVFVDSQAPDTGIDSSQSQVMTPAEDTIVSAGKIVPPVPDPGGPAIEASISQEIKPQAVTVPDSGYLWVKTRPPFAAVFINDKAMGSTPMKVPVKLSAGTHHLRIEKQGCEPLERELKVRSKDTLQMALELKRNP